nr:hypothetical protein [Geomicrobium sp. JCM 19038]
MLELEGTPKKSEGIVGKMELFMSELFDRPHDEKEIVKHAIKGENIYGNKMTEKIASEELDEHNQQLIHTILSKQREHVDELKMTLNNMN